jgi:hypothetical protein
VSGLRGRGRHRGGALGGGRGGRGGEVPGQQRLAAVSGDHGGGEVLGRIEAMQLGGLEDRVERGRDLRAEPRLRAVVVLAPDDGAANGALGGVVVERDACVVDEAREARPVCDGVGGGLADREGLERGLLPEPVLERVEDRRRLGAPQLGDAREVAVGGRSERG